MTSLRNRAVAGGIIWAIVVTVIGIYGLGSFLDRLTLSRFDDLLQSRHAQVVVALANSEDRLNAVDMQSGTPIYSRPLSGDYWQATNEAGGIIVSRSLVDGLLPSVPNSTDGTLQLRSIDGPSGIILREAYQRISFNDGETWTVQVASSTRPLIAERAFLLQRLKSAFAMIGFVAIVGALLLVLATLRPLTKLRRDVSARWDSDDGLATDSYPSEVMPLVNDINLLLDRNRDIVDRSRRQAADLAHALKTPSAILRNELEALDHAGTNVRASLDALSRLDGQLARSFARMRTVEGNAAVQAATELDTALGRMTRAFGSLAQNHDRDFNALISPNLRARIDQSDLEEVTGNLLDNALKWSTSALEIKAFAEDDMIHIHVGDDGPGIPEDQHRDALISGQRLDTSKPGTGLGLAIAVDLVKAYGGSLDLSKSPLGGLQVTIMLPQVQTTRMAA